MTWWPGWDSIDSANAWAHFWFWFGIVCLFLLGVSEIVAFRYGLRKDTLIEMRDQEREALAKRESEEAEARRKTEVARLQKQLTDADKKVAELDRLRAPRHLNDAQKTALLIGLTGQPIGQLVVKASTAADDARAYAGEVAAFFQGLGWQVRIDNALMVGPDVSGIWPSIKDNNAVPPATVALQRAFETAGFPIRNAVTVDAGVPTPNEIWLSIGVKK